jgi:GGDEF domain-containing protein
MILAVANICRSTLRKTDTACRLGGDEFVVALPNT